jgi:hypothetical protein
MSVPANEYTPSIPSLYRYWIRDHRRKVSSTPASASITKPSLKPTARRTRIQEEKKKEEKKKPQLHSRPIMPPTRLGYLCLMIHKHRSESNCGILYTKIGVTPPDTRLLAIILLPYH